jgi:hypothetical protein
MVKSVVGVEIWVPGRMLMGVLMMLLPVFVISRERKRVRKTEREKRPPFKFAF